MDDRLKRFLTNGEPAEGWLDIAACFMSTERLIEAAETHPFAWSALLRRAEWYRQNPSEPVPEPFVRWLLRVAVGDPPAHSRRGRPREDERDTRISMAVATLMHLDELEEPEAIACVAAVLPLSADTVGRIYRRGRK